MEFDQKIEETEQGKLACKNCGAILSFKPGTKNLKCEYCGAENEIEGSDAVIEEINYRDFISNQLESEEKVDIISVKCTTCGAQVSFPPNITSDECPYCSSNIIVKNGTPNSVLRPKSLVPFVIDKRKANTLFRTWISKLWFAPSKLKERTSKGKINGVYVPYWTYDSDITSSYTGERGIYYYVTETYTDTENGQSVTKTREVRRTRWSSASGTISHFFDDILIIASKSLPEKIAKKLNSWKLSELVPFNEKYLSGFKSEAYQVDIKDGFEKAKIIIDRGVDSLIRQDIGGDEQRVFSANTSYNKITFKHILLPIWISSYKYNNKVYRFLINGQSGKVQGERPYSYIKIALLVIAIIAVIIAIAHFS